MEIRCENCQHVGAAEVVSDASGVVLVCANCSHHNALGLPAGSAVAASIPAAASTTSREPFLQKDALLRLMPEPGPGPRCQKCAHKLREEESHCPRCGLAREEGERYERGFAPWDSPPDGKEEVHEQAALLYKALAANPSEENLTKFATFVRDEGLLEYGVRQLRFFVVEHPDVEGGQRYLEELASSFQARLIVAQAKAQVGNGDFAQSAERVKRAVTWLVFLVWGGIFIFFLYQLLN